MLELILKLKNQSLTTIVVAIIAFSAPPTFADDLKQQELETAGLYVDLMKDLPSTAQLINAPYPQAFDVYGTKKKVDNKSIIKGGKALRIKVPRSKKHSYSKGATNKTIADINKGDTLCLTFWARSINPPEANLSAEFASLGVQQNTAPYHKLMDSSASLTHDWLQYAYKSVADEAHKAGDAAVFFHFGHLKQRFEIGPTFLFNLGQDIAADFKSNACGK